MPGTFVWLVVSAGMCAFAQQPQQQEDGPAFFEKNIRPILAQQCLGCHSAASQPVMGDLRLDDRAHALQGGSRGPAIVPGNPAESLLVKVLLHTAGPLRMPPGPKMKAADAALFAEWIRMGAPWGKPSSSTDAASLRDPGATQPYWAFVPPSQNVPAVPKVRQQAWVRNPVDSFVLAALEAKGLTPAPPADKRTLLRRATFDLTGLPPTPAEIRDFLADSSPDAYTKVIDRLLASPRYGERWARHWLDVARYADSNGLDENLVYKNAFRYRDYVIAAFNKDKPYNQFVVEQIAGDLLPEAKDLETQYERWTATGFLSLGAKMLAEDDPVKMEMDIVDEQLDTTMRAFNGLTVGCARCHNHKFDPIPQADYYAMAGIFKSAKTMENFKVVAKWHEYVLAPKADRDRLTAHEAKIEDKRKEINRLTRSENERLSNEAIGRVGAYLLAAGQLQRDSAIQVAPLEKEVGAIVRTAGSFDSGNAPRTLEKKKSNAPKDVPGPYFANYIVQVPESGDYQLDVFDEEKGAGTADIWVNNEWVKQGAPPVQNREASPEAGGWSYGVIVRLRKGANTIRLEHASRFPYFEKFLLARNTLSHAPQTAVQIAARHGVNPGILDHLVEYLERSNGAAASVLYAWETAGNPNRSVWVSPVAKLFQTEKTPEEIAARYGELFLEAERAGKDTKDAASKALYDFLHEKFGPFRAPENARRYYGANIQANLRSLEKELKDLEAATPDLPRAMGVTESGHSADLAIHLRGSHWTLGDKVPRGFLSALSKPNNVGLQIPPNESGRLQLAQWISDSRHPLTSRVMVNRIWRWRFGRGIVPSVDNFGRLGEKPSNQALLDWLAVTFAEKQGWSIKAMHRLMMLSNTYQMSSQYNDKAHEADPENVLLWRFPRKRLEVEAVRDAIMTSSGGLTHESPGGSILKYKDRQYVANTSKGGDVDYDRPIRAIYIPVVRSSLYDVFRAFDLPDPATSNGDRDATVVAPQALFMMNSSVMLQQSKRMAERLLQQVSGDDVARIREAYESSLSRPPTPQEIDQAQTFLARIGQQWNGDRLKAWQSFCKSLLSTNEFIYLN